MNKQYFENEEEAREFYEKTFPTGYVNAGTTEKALNQCVENAKEAGYIKKATR